MSYKNTFIVLKMNNITLLKGMRTKKNEFRVDNKVSRNMHPVTCGRVLRVLRAKG